MYMQTQKGNCPPAEGTPSRVTPKFVPIGRQATTAGNLQTTTSQSQEDV